MAVTYDSTTDTYSMTFTEFETWLPNQSDNTVSTPYNVFITEVDASNCQGSSSSTLIEHTFQYVLRNNTNKYVALQLTTNTTGVRLITTVHHSFYKCTNLVSADISGMSNVTDAQSMFAYCSNLISVNVNGMSAVTNASSMFFGCTSLVSADASGMSGVNDASSMFFGCTSLVSANVSGMFNVTSAQSMFRECTSLISVNASNMSSVINVNSMFLYCTSLTSVDISGMSAVTNAGSMFRDCVRLTNISVLPYNINNNVSYYQLFYGVNSLYNIGIIRTVNNITGKYRLYGTNVKAAGVLVSSLSAYDLQDWNGTKFYTTLQYYSGLSTELATDYPNNNFEVIEVDACLDYDELEAWLEAQPQNTAETPYKIFIGGGLSADKVKGSWSDYSFTSVTPSDLSNIILTNGKYVDLSCTQLPSDCTDLTAAVSGKKRTLDLTETKQQYITKFCEIPSSVTTAKAFAMYSNGLKSFGDDNVIPSSVTNAQKFLHNTDNIGYVKIEHQLTNNSNYQDWVLESNSKIYAKDYTYFANNYSSLHTNRQIILECDYSDLDTYLGWFRNSCSDVNLKVTGLSSSDLIGSSSTGSALCSKLLGTNISDSTVKGYVAGSTFDLRLTEIPSNQNSLLGCFFEGNISYCFPIPNTVTDMSYTFEGCSLIVAPILPTDLTNLESTFRDSSITEAPVIPSLVTNMKASFWGTGITEMPNIPYGMTNLESAFVQTNIIKTKVIPLSVTNMKGCFLGCSALSEVLNIPSNVTNLQVCFSMCTSLVKINGWGVDTNNVTMNLCFHNCPNLIEINTTTKQTVDYDKWVHITVKTDTTDNTKYNLTLRTLATETQQAQTLTIQVDKAVIYSYLTDEILFSPNGTLSDSYITDMLNYKYPFGGGLDPSRKNFVLWAAQNSNVITNIGGGGGSGTVKSVNNILPDANGDVTITDITGSSGSCTGNAATATTARRIGTTSGSTVGDIWIS